MFAPNPCGFPENANIPIDNSVLGKTENTIKERLTVIQYILEITRFPLARE